MNINRQPEVVEAFHYDINRGQESETFIRVSVNPMEEENAEKNTLLGLRVEFNIVFQEFLLAGSVTQVTEIIGKKIASSEDCSKEELEELTRPLFSLIERLAYEVTEIALDQPGVQLNFETE